MKNPILSLRRRPAPFRLFGCACLAAMVLAVPRSAGADEPAQAPSAATLDLAGGDYARGQLVDSTDGAGADRAMLAWQAEGFVGPFRIPLEYVQGVHFPAPAQPIKPRGEYCFELTGGDVLFGSLVALDEREAVLDCAGFGTLHVERNRLCRIASDRAARLMFLGPRGLIEWRTLGRAESWREDGAQLVSSTPGALLERNFSLPANAWIEIELGWLQKPQFDLALGVDLHDQTPARTYRLEVWKNQIVAVCEAKQEADLAAVAEIQAGAGSVHLQILLDQTRGRFQVFTAAGEQLADLSLNTEAAKDGAAPKVGGGLVLTNRGADLRLTRLRIGGSNGAPPAALGADQARLVRVDGTTIRGQIQTYDAQERRFTVRTADGSQTVDQPQVQDILLAGDAPDRQSQLRLIQLAGAQISGELEKVEGQKIYLRVPGIRESLSAPVESLHALVVLRPQTPPEAAKDHRQGRLELDGVRLTGALVDADAQSGSPLVWRPRQSTTAGGLRGDVSARIVYREPPAPSAKPKIAAANPRPVQRPAGLLGAVQAVLSAGTRAHDSSQGSGTPVLHLRLGDMIPCKVLRIDEEGVAFESEQADAKFVRHDQLKALELLPATAPVAIAKPKRERLLTLPRMQRDSPPTQLIRSIDGDYVRGRLLALDDKQVKVEVRLEPRSLPREQVARIIWLHADEYEKTPHPQPAAQQAGIRVQTLKGDGNRLTFYAQRLAGSTLAGQSDLLGACRVDLEQVDQLFIGQAIDQAASELAFHGWKLKPAPDPLSAAAGEGESTEGAPGLESSLVGKPAPDIELDLVGGRKFKLSDHRGKVVVLDFWASWCGPCLQVMPLVDKVSREFADQGVELVGINLEEPEERVKTALERLQLRPTIALDRNGRVAERYGATSIPQTVIVARDGTVARLFVGGGPRFDEQLREALRSVLADAQAAEKPSDKPAAEAPESK